MCNCVCIIILKECFVNIDSISGVPPRGVVTATAVPSSFQNTSPLVRPPIQGGGVVLATPTSQPVLNIPLQISHSVDNPLSLVVNSIPVCSSNESKYSSILKCLSCFIC